MKASDKLTNNIDKSLQDKKVIDMEATKATVSIANTLMDKNKLDDVVKIGGKAIGAVSDLVSGKVEGGISESIATVSDGVDVLVKNQDFINN